MTDTSANSREFAFAFNCQGDDLVGFIHKGDERCGIGVLTIVAGGPQYRGGVGRQLVNLGRRLSSEGISVMRFDHRGIGDSEGAFRRFDSMQDDIAAAIEAFRKRVPHVRRVILWGGCDAGTSALINAHRFPEVICVIAGNPYVSSAATSTKMARKHYMSRLMQASFWKKLLRGEYNIAEYVTAAVRKLRRKIRKSPNENPGRKPAEASGNFLDDLLVGLKNFQGRVLFLMGDRFLLSDEFDALVNSSPEWRSAYGKSRYERFDIKGGDQVFSSTEAQNRMFDAASDWIHRTFPEHVIQKAQSVRQKSDESGGRK